MQSQRNQHRRRPGRANSQLSVARAVFAAGAAVLPGITAAHAEVSTNNAGPVQQGQTGGVNNPAETISLSGTTSFAQFIQSGAISLLSPGSSIILHDGSG